MADLRSNFIGIKSPNPFWLASAPPTDKEYNVVRAFKAGWGGVVWKTLGEEGPPIVNVNGPRYGAIHGADRRLLGLNNIELITDRPLEVNLQEIRQVKREWPDRAMIGSRAWSAAFALIAPVLTAAAAASATCFSVRRSQGMTPHLRGLLGFTTMDPTLHQWPAHAIHLSARDSGASKGESGYSGREGPQKPGSGPLNHRGGVPLSCAYRARASQHTQRTCIPENTAHAPIADP